MPTNEEQWTAWFQWMKSGSARVLRVCSDLAGAAFELLAIELKGVGLLGFGFRVGSGYWVFYHWLSIMVALFSECTPGLL